MQIFNILYTDAPSAWQIGFQDSGSYNFTGIVELHDFILFFLVFISFGVFWILGSTIINFNSHKKSIIHKYLTHGTLIELIWTISPAFILLAIANPSFNLLYLLDEVIAPSLTLKVLGHQWYWSFEYSDYETESGDPIDFDSYLVPENDLEEGQYRLLEVDNKVNVPLDTHVRLVAQGADVIHDYAIPSLAVKIDAVPGRLNQCSLITERLGEFFGQCSEICGAYHGFMPTIVQSLSVNDYLSWVNEASMS
jgi:cytochrome c oxidase subunit 2